VVDLDDVHRTGSGGNGDTEAEQETTAHELAGRVFALGDTLDDGTEDDSQGADEHADTATPGINSGADEGESDDTANLVHGRDDTCPDTGRLGAVLFLEPRILEQVVDERAIIPVHGGTEETDEGASVDDDLSLAPGPRGLLEHGLIEGLIAGDDLSLDILLLVHVVIMRGSINNIALFGHGDGWMSS